VESVIVRRTSIISSVLFVVSAVLLAWAFVEMLPQLRSAAILTAASAAIAGAAAAVAVFGERSADRKLEKILSDTRKELETAVAERDKAINDISDRLRQFHSKVSHSLRIPISVIQGYADLLREGLIADDEISKEYLSRISERIEYINELLGQIFLEAQTDGSIYTVPLEPVDICRLVERIADDVRTAAMRLNISINVVLVEEGIMINGDINLLTKIFYNILGNSLKYMNREGLINITVSREGKEVLIIFKDNGMGLSEEETEHIFELNYQGSNKTTGDGFGLYFVMNGVMVLGGKVFAKSSPGAGMSIYMVFPALETERGEKGAMSF
jgi:signal transduction histidine kinase